MLVDTGQVKWHQPLYTGLKAVVFKRFRLVYARNQSTIGNKRASS